MRLFLIGLCALLATAALGVRPSVAQNYPWCADYFLGAGTNCGFSTLEQCLATISGIGGTCRPNPFYFGGGGPPDERGHYRRRHDRRHRYD